MNVKLKIYNKLALFCRDYFKDRDYFTLVYGSYASNDFTENSDLDFFIATRKHGITDFKRVRDFIVDLSVKNNLKIHNEVPYKNKLIVSYKDVKDALNLKAFVKKSTKYLIHPITEDRKFLASREVRLRIILNALTSPNQYICGNKEKYILYKHKAEKALLKLVHGLTEKTNLTDDDILGILLKGAHGEESGAYLGYRNHRPKVVKYLKDLISRSNIF